MLVYIAENFTIYFGFLNLFKYITFRTGGAILTALFFSLIFGQTLINFLSSLQPVGQPFRSDGPKKHIIEKAGTPTMGGVLILGSILVSVFIWADLKNIYIWITLLSTFSFGLIGLIDDYIKIRSLKNDGLKISIRIFFQLLFGLFIVYLIYSFFPIIIPCKK